MMACIWASCADIAGPFCPESPPELNLNYGGNDRLVIFHSNKEEINIHKIGNKNMWKKLKYFTLYIHRYFNDIFYTVFPFWKKGATLIINSQLSNQHSWGSNSTAIWWWQARITPQSSKSRLRFVGAKHLRLDFMAQFSLGCSYTATQQQNTVQDFKITSLLRSKTQTADLEHEGCIRSTEAHPP